MTDDIRQVSESRGRAARVEEFSATELARILEEKESELIEIWHRLGRHGPTLGSSEAGSDEEAQQRYLRPLARLLIGGLRGSNDHLAVYLDERGRYVRDDLPSRERQVLLADRLSPEIDAVVGLVEDQIDPEVTRRILSTLHRPLLHQEASRVKVLFIGDCLFVETRALLAPVMARRECPVETSHIFFSATQQVERVNSAVANEILRRRPDVIGISLFTFEGIPMYRTAWRSAASIMGSGRTAFLVEGLITTLQRLIDDIRSVTEATIVLHSPGGLPLDPLRRRVPIVGPHSRGQRKLRSMLGERVAGLAASSINVTVLDEAELIAQAGGVRTMARPLFSAHDVPPGYTHPSRLGAVVADAYADLLGDFDLLRSAKVLLVDFDNTLWAGVMGDGPVEHHLARQQLLLDLRRAGVLLVAVSKNDPQLIRWHEMELAESDFALTKINWRPKVDNVREAVIELDLAADSFLLLDDNPVERSLVADYVPGVKTLDATESRSWRALRYWLSFPSTAQTEEAHRRNVMYREAAARRSAMNSAGDYGAMMATLKLKHTVRAADGRDVQRILELMQRTNQFNTTTHRRSLAEVSDLIRRDDIGVYVATLSDRFGDLGIVAVAVFERRTRLFESVIMSCRAMGFGLEIALVCSVIDSEDLPGHGFRGRFVQTERNNPAADLFARAGFVQVNDHLWELEPGERRPERPSWLA